MATRYFFRNFRNLQERNGEGSDKTASPRVFELWFQFVGGPTFVLSQSVAAPASQHRSFALPWLRFDVTTSTPRFDPVLVLDWRSGATGHGEEVHITAPREFRASIVSATNLVREDVIARVVVWP